MPNLLNAPDVVAWNTDKRYLPTWPPPACPRFRASSSRRGRRSTLPRGRGGGEARGRSGIGWGATVHRCRTTRDRTREACRRTGRTVLVQPYDPRIADGETALVFLGGRAVARLHQGAAAAAAGREAGARRVRHLRRGDPATRRPRLRAVGRRTCGTRRGGRRGSASSADEFLYARVDVIGGRDDPRLLELELVEPSLGWRQLDEAERDLPQREFALGVESALDRLGLGPCKSTVASTPIAPRSRRCTTAAPATCTATSAAGTPVKNCTVPTMPCSADQDQQHDRLAASPAAAHAPRAARSARPISSAR